MGTYCEVKNIKEQNLKLKVELNKLQNQIRFKESKDEINAINFYDVIVNIQSIKDIIKGWHIKVNKNKNYENMIKEKVLKIGVLGNSNKGKSFILSRISKIELPTGTSIKTEGLSIKYPELELYKDRKIVLLDSAGFEAPVLEEKNDKKYDQNDNDYFKEKSREKMITELFLQNYILHNSDILIVVVGLLTYSEQKLLNKIKRDLIKAKLNKTLYVIHNLMTFVTTKQVDDYINNTLLKCSTFKLEKQTKVTSKLTIENGVSYFEKNNGLIIYHLIFANEYSDAGKYYNGYTLKFLEDLYKTYTNLESFDIKTTLIKRFKEVSKEIIEKVEEDLDFDESQKDIIKLIKPKEIVLKKCLIDELGFQNLKTNGFEPPYNYYTKNNQMIVKVEAPGNCSLKSSIYYSGEYVIIKLEGIKENDREPYPINKNIFNNRETGKFSLDIPLKFEEYMIRNVEPKIINKNGVFILCYQLDKVVPDGVFKQREEDKI